MNTKTLNWRILLTTFTVISTIISCSALYSLYNNVINPFRDYNEFPNITMKNMTVGEKIVAYSKHNLPINLGYIPLDLKDTYIWATHNNKNIVFSILCSNHKYDRIKDCHVASFKNDVILDFTEDKITVKRFNNGYVESNDVELIDYTFKTKKNSSFTKIIIPLDIFKDSVHLEATRELELWEEVKTIDIDIIK